jgi:hypothetical protein
MTSASPLAGTQDMLVLPTAVAVCSESDPGTVYQVQLPYCPCKDYRYRRANWNGDFSKLFCKHLVSALDRVAGWHNSAEPTEAIALGGRDQPVVFPDITQVAAKVILRGALVGMGARDSNHLFTEAHKSADGIAEFKAALCGATVDGQVQIDRLRGRCTLTLYPGR